jgi:pSer/pThr/pTyr-binding forkhead associated (FHA) protein
VLQSGPQRGRKLPLRRGLNRIGQDADSEIVLPFDTVSRRHAEIEVGRGGRVLIRDLDSTNGTWVNDKRVEEEGPLREGDRVRFADVELVYEP